jgi:hypothetical protein
MLDRKMTTLQRLLLKLERELVVRGRLRLVLIDADLIVANRRHDVKVEKARLSRQKRIRLS